MENIEKDKLFSESAEADTKEEHIVMEEEVVEEKMSEETEEKEEDKEMSEEKEIEDSEDKEMAEEITKECAEEEQEKDMSCEDSEDKEMAEEEAEDKAEEDKEMSEKEEFSCNDDKKMEEQAEEKSMSEQAKEFAETDEEKEFIGKLFASELNEIVECILSLKKFQDTRVAMETEHRLNQILANVKGNIDDKKFAEFQEEGKQLNLFELDAFENKVKAFAYDEFAKTKNCSSNKEEVLVFANTDTDSVKAELSADDIYKKYL